MVVVTSLGIGGMLAGGCGGDDEAPGGASGAGGKGGSSTGASGTKAGGSGTGTAGTTAGGSGTVDSGGSDAPVACMPAKTAPTPTEKATCQAGLNGDSGGTCLSNCFCNACPKEAVACLGNPMCKAIVDCAAEKHCSSTAECIKPENCQAVLAANAAGLTAATDFACCGGTCQAMCPTGTPEGGTDASPDAPKADAPASDAPASDAPTSDAPADTGSTVDTGITLDAANEGG